MINDMRTYIEREFELPMYASKWTQFIKFELNMNSSTNALVKSLVEVLIINIYLSKEELSVHQ